MSLFGGLAGVGLTLLHFAEAAGQPRFRTAAERLGERLVARESTPDQPPRPGLMHGASGPALFLIRLYEHLGDPALLNRAGAELRRDVAGCVWTGDGTLQVDEGWRVLPYVATGSAGIGMVLHEYLRHREASGHTADAEDTGRTGDAGLTDALRGIDRAAHPAFVAQSGLFNGWAGLAAHLLHTRRPGQVVAPLDRHLQNLGWNAVPYGGGVAFVGDQLARLSMDFATGSAGVLCVLGAALTGRVTCLPFLTRKGEHGQREEVNEYGVDP